MNEAKHSNDSNGSQVPSEALLRRLAKAIQEEAKQSQGDQDETLKHLQDASVKADGKLSSNDYTVHDLADAGVKRLIAATYGDTSLHAAEVFAKSMNAVAKLVSYGAKYGTNLRGDGVKTMRVSHASG